MASDIKNIIKIVLEDYVNERFVRSEKPDEERYAIVANKVIEFMDNENIPSIPDYSTLANWKPQDGATYKPNMKYFLQKFVRQGEYFQKIVPLIKSMRPDFTTSFKSGRHRVDEFVVVFSNGEKIVFNTFKMNGIALVPHPKEYEFAYVYDGQVLIKKPDFLWSEQNEIIEVAGLEDGSFNKDYMKKLLAAKKQSEKDGVPMVILDYFKYRKNLQAFYKYVCETFGFPYHPMDFWTANIVHDLPVEDLKRELNELILKGGSKKYGERFKQNKIIQLLGYKSAWEYKREEGIGMRWNDPELRKQIQMAWCDSTGSNQKTYEKFRELFPGIKISKTMIETMRKKFPQEFDMNRRIGICFEEVSKEEVDLNEGFTDYILKKLGKYPFHQYQKAVNNFLDIQNFKVKIWDTYDALGQRQVIIYKDNEHLPVIKIRKSLNKDNKWKKIALIDNELLRKMERYIPSKGLVSCVMEWVKNKTGEKNIDEFELF